MLFFPVRMTGYLGASMREVPTTEAKSRFAELVRAVKTTVNPIATTRHGKTVTHLIPALRHERASQKEPWSAPCVAARAASYRHDQGKEILAARHEGIAGELLRARCIPSRAHGFLKTRTTPVANGPFHGSRPGLPRCCGSGTWRCAIRWSPRNGADARVRLGSMMPRLLGGVGTQRHQFRPQNP